MVGTRGGESGGAPLDGLLLTPKLSYAHNFAARRTRHDVQGLAALSPTNTERECRMAKDETRAARAGVGGPQDMIRSIYAARSAAAGTSSGGDFARIKISNPDHSLRAAYVSHLSKPKEEAPRDAGPSENVLRKAYVAHIIADAGARK